MDHLQSDEEVPWVVPPPSPWPNPVVNFDYPALVYHLLVVVVSNGNYCYSWKDSPHHLNYTHASSSVWSNWMKSTLATETKDEEERHHHLLPVVVDHSCDDY
jgi:hypothetical protein